MNARDRIRTRRRFLGFTGVLLGCVAVAEAKNVSAPPTHHINLGSGGSAFGNATGPAPAASPGGQPHPSPSGGSGGASGGASATRTVTGQSIDIGYGIVQVRVVLSGHRIDDVVAVQLPSGGRSGDIASFAVPELRREVLDAQSANIDSVSGASYTSYGYAKSVQSALDAASS